MLVFNRFFNLALAFSATINHTTIQIQATVLVVHGGGERPKVLSETKSYSLRMCRSLSLALCILLYTQGELRRRICWWSWRMLASVFAL